MSTDTPTPEPLNWLQAKDEAAQKLGFKDFAYLMYSYPTYDFLTNFYKEAAKLYGASQFARGAREQREIICDYYSYHFPITSDQVSDAPAPQFKP